MQEKEEFSMLYDEFENIDIYNSFYIKSSKYIENIQIVENDEIKIKNLIGNNGKIDKKEILNIQKNIDKL